MRLDVLLKLSQSALGLFEGQEVFLSIDRTYQFVLSDLEFGTAYRVFCLQKSGLILGCLDVGIGLGFHNLLFSLCEVTPVLSKVVFLLARVKFKHDFPSVHLGAGASQRDDLQGAPGDRWRGPSFGGRLCNLHSKRAARETRFFLSDRSSSAVLLGKRWIFEGQLFSRLQSF